MKKLFSQTDKCKALPPLAITELPSKLLNWFPGKLCLLKYRFTIFRKKILCSTLALYVANIAINVIYIGVAQQRVFVSVRNSYRTFAARRRKTNADKRFLMDNILLSILALQAANISVDIISASFKFSNNCELSERTGNLQMLRA